MMYKCFRGPTVLLQNKTQIYQLYISGGKGQTAGLPDLLSYDSFSYVPR